MSPGKELGIYLSSRFPVTRFIPVAGFLTAAGLAHTLPASLLPWAIAMVQVFIMILLYRLWDDIADLDYDRRAHPERVLCDTRNLNAFLALAGILFVINGILLLWLNDSYLRPNGYFVLCIGLLAWYRFRSVTSSPGLLNSYIVLAKYPVIVWLVSPPLGNSDTLSYMCCLFSVYLIFVVFEILDDSYLAQLKAAKICLVTSFSFLIGVWILIAFLNKAYTNPGFGILWSVIVISTSALGVAGWLQLKKTTEPGIGHGLFIAGLLAYLAIGAEKNL